VGFNILKEAAISGRDQHERGRVIRLLPTFRAAYGIFLIGKGADFKTPTFVQSLRHA
jgi:hypothetical protein